MLPLCCAEISALLPSLRPGDTFSLHHAGQTLQFVTPATPLMLRRVASAIRNGAVEPQSSWTWREIEADVAARTAQLHAMIDARLARTRLHLAS